MFCILRGRAQLLPLLESNASLFGVQSGCGWSGADKGGHLPKPRLPSTTTRTTTPETVNSLFSQQTQQRRRTPNPVSARFSTELPCLCRADPGPWPGQSYEGLFSLTLSFKTYTILSALSSGCFYI